MSDAIARGGNSDFHADAENPPDDLRTRIAQIVNLHDLDTGDCGCDPQDWWLHVADAVIAELPELRRIEQVREVCAASINVDARRGDSTGDRAWLAGTVLNVLNGEVDE